MIGKNSSNIRNEIEHWFINTAQSNGLRLEMDCSWYAIPSACFNLCNSVETPNKRIANFYAIKSKLTEVWRQQSKDDSSIANQLSTDKQMPWDKEIVIQQVFFWNCVGDMPIHSGRFAKIWFQVFETMKASCLRWTKASANSNIGETNDWYWNFHAILSTHVLKTDRDNFHVHQRELFVINTASHCNVAELYF